jgi:hypothetical protein
MSKDKGVKNIKKAPADKTKAIKVVSSYKSEGKITVPITMKTDGKTGK